MWLFLSWELIIRQVSRCGKVSRFKDERRVKSPLFYLEQRRIVYNEFMEATMIADPLTFSIPIAVILVIIGISCILFGRK